MKLNYSFINKLDEFNNVNKKNISKFERFNNIEERGNINLYKVNTKYDEENEEFISGKEKCWKLDKKCIYNRGFKILKLKNMNIDIHKFNPYDSRRKNKYIFYHNKVYTVILTYPYTLDMMDFFRNNVDDITYFCPDLLSIIEDDDGNFKGYQFREGKTISDNKFYSYIYKNKERLIKFLEKSKCYYCDFKPSNIIDVNGRINIIDLDSFKKISNLQVIKVWNLRFSWYLDKIKELSKNS